MMAQYFAPRCFLNKTAINVRVTFIVEGSEQFVSRNAHSFSAALAPYFNQVIRTINCKNRSLFFLHTIV